MRPNVHTEYAYIYFYNHQRIQLKTGVAQRERRAPGKMKHPIHTPKCGWGV